MSFGQIAQNIGIGFINYGTIVGTVLVYFGIRFILGRFAVKETIIRLILGLGCLMFALSTSAVGGAQILREGYKGSLMLNFAPGLLFFLAAVVGIHRGAIRRPFEGWVRVPTSVEEGRKPAEVDQARRTG